MWHQTTRQPSPPALPPGLGTFRRALIVCSVASRRAAAPSLLMPTLEHCPSMRKVVPNPALCRSVLHVNSCRDCRKCLPYTKIAVPSIHICTSCMCEVSRKCKHTLLKCAQFMGVGREPPVRMHTCAGKT